MYHELWARAVSQAGTAVLHSIIRFKTQFRTRNSPTASLPPQASEHFDRPVEMFFCSLFHTHLFAITFWGTKYELFLLLRCQQEGAARCVAQHFGLLTCESREPKALQRQKLLSKNSMHDCSCLSILLAAEHSIQEELLSFQTPVGSQHKPISFLVFPA